MGRLGLKDTEKLQARFYFAVIKSKTNLSEAQMDMKFCDPKFVRPYDERRRIFNRLKLGYMPYRGKSRENFISRIASYPDLAFTAKAYNSTFWELASKHHDRITTNELALNCLKNLNLFSGREVNEFYSLVYKLQNKIDINKELSFFGSIDSADLYDYQNLLSNVLEDHNFNLDSLTFCAILYKDAIFQGKLEIASLLKLYYAKVLTLICSHYKIDVLLKNDLIDISINNILNITKPNDETLLSFLRREVHKDDDSLNLMLESFLIVHDSL